MKTLKTLKRIVKKVSAVTCLGTACCFLTPLADAATTTSTVANVGLTATLNQSILLTVAPTTAAFSSLNLLGTGSVASTITVTTTWALNTGTTLTVYGYFATATSALSDTKGDNIPTSAISGAVDGGTSVVFTGTSPLGTGTGLTIYTAPILAANAASLHTDTLVLGLSLAGLGTLPPGTYTGTMYVEAQAL